MGIEVCVVLKAAAAMPNPSSNTNQYMNASAAHLTVPVDLYVAPLPLAGGDG